LSGLSNILKKVILDKSGDFYQVNTENITTKTFQNTENYVLQIRISFKK
jgi:hypothetical protein